MLDVRGLLQPPERFGPRRPGEAEQRQQRCKQCHPEGAEQHTMEKRRGDAPQVEQRHDEKGANDEEGPEQGLPYALGQERQPAQRHAALETQAERFVFRSSWLGPLRTED